MYMFAMSKYTSYYALQLDQKSSEILYIRTSLLDGVVKNITVHDESLYGRKSMWNGCLPLIKELEKTLQKPTDAFYQK